jgi:hypothetical protein
MRFIGRITHMRIFLWRNVACAQLCLACWFPALVFIRIGECSIIGGGRKATGILPQIHLQEICLLLVHQEKETSHHFVVVLSMVIITERSYREPGTERAIA